MYSDVDFANWLLDFVAWDYGLRSYVFRDGFRQLAYGFCQVAYGFRGLGLWISLT